MKKRKHILSTRKNVGMVTNKVKNTLFESYMLKFKVSHTPLITCLRT